MTIPPSTRPVYLKGPKGKGEAELWVRVGNSTRRLEVADAVQYVALRWPESVRVSPLTRIRLFLTMTRHRETPTRLPRVVERVLTERAKHGGGSSEGGAGARLDWPQELREESGRRAPAQDPSGGHRAGHRLR